MAKGFNSKQIWSDSTEGDNVEVVVFKGGDAQILSNYLILELSADEALVLVNELLAMVNATLDTIDDAIDADGDEA